MKGKAQPRARATLIAAMSEHPWRTLAGAFLAGAAIAFDASPRRRVASKLGAMARAATLDVLRDLALVGVLGVLDSLTRRRPTAVPAAWVPDQPVAQA